MKKNQWYGKRLDPEFAARRVPVARKAAKMSWGNWSVFGYTALGHLTELGRFDGQADANEFARYLACESQIEGYCLFAVERTMDRAEGNKPGTRIGSGSRLDPLPNTLTWQIHADALAEQEEKGAAPLCLELAKRWQLSRAGVSRHLTALVAAGAAVKPPYPRMRWKFVSIDPEGEYTTE